MVLMDMLAVTEFIFPPPYALQHTDSENDMSELFIMTLLGGD